MPLLGHSGPLIMNFSFLVLWTVVRVQWPDRMTLCMQVSCRQQLQCSCWATPAPFSCNCKLVYMQSGLRPLMHECVYAGLVPPAASVFLLGHSGAILMVTMLFMAVTSAGSAELVAVSSLFTYDVYKTYINKNATGERLNYQNCDTGAVTSHASPWKIRPRRRLEQRQYLQS